MNTLTKSRITIGSVVTGTLWWFLMVGVAGLSIAILVDPSFRQYLSISQLNIVVLGSYAALYLFYRSWREYDVKYYWLGVLTHVGVVYSIVFGGTSPNISVKWVHLFGQVTNLVFMYYLLSLRLHWNASRPSRFTADSGHKVKQQMADLQNEANTIKYKAEVPTLSFANIFGMTETKTRLHKAGLEIVDSIKANSKS